MGLIREFTRLQTDVTLARQEMLLGWASKPLLRKAPLRDGEGRPVMLLPGFGANEALLKPLKAFLEHCGYVVEIFVPGFPQGESLDRFIDDIGITMAQRIQQLKKTTGKPVSLVGQSAGGLYSREYVLRNPANIDRVITLGSPTFCPENRHLQNQALTVLIQRVFGTSAEQTFGGGRFLHWDKSNPEIPYIAIYSPIDGAVRAETVVIPESNLNLANNGAIRENIAILASHFGMVQNPLVMLAVADRLGADKNNWQAFAAADHLPDAMLKFQSLAYPPVNLDKYDIPLADLHAQQPRSRNARERVVSTLRSEHYNIEKLIDTVLDETGSSAQSATGVPDYGLIAGILDYLGNYTDHFHHPREDLIFARLQKHKPELQTTLQKLQLEHEVIETQGLQLSRELSLQLEGTATKARNKSLDARCRRYVKKLRKHLQVEEQDIFPHAEVLGKRDWQAIDKGLTLQPDPLFGDAVVDRYETLATALAGRVEGISEAATLRNIFGLGALANGMQTLGEGLLEIGEEQLAMARKTAAKQKQFVDKALDKPSAWALATLPLSMTKENLSLALENSKSSFAAVRQLGRQVGQSWHKGGAAP